MSVTTLRGRQRNETIRAELAAKVTAGHDIHDCSVGLPESRHAVISSREVMVSMNQYMSFSASCPRPPQVNRFGVSYDRGNRGTKPGGDGYSFSARCTEAAVSQSPASFFTGPMRGSP